MQFGTTRSLLELQQHSGRAGRDGLPAYSLLLVEPSVLQVVQRKKPRLTKGKGASSTKASRAPQPKTASNKSGPAAPTVEPAASTQERASTSSREVGASVYQSYVSSAAQVKDEPVEINISSLQLRKRVFLECEDNISDEELASEMPPQAGTPSFRAGYVLLHARLPTSRALPFLRESRSLGHAYAVV